MAHEGSTPTGGSSLTDPLVSAPTTPERGYRGAPPPAPSLASELLRGFRRCWLLASSAGLLSGATVGALLWSFLPQTHTAEISLHVPVSREEAPEAARIQSSAVLQAVLRRPDVADLPAVRRQRDPLSWLGDHLSVTATPIPDILRVRVVSDRADEAAVLVEAVVDAYRQEAARRSADALSQLEGASRREEEGLQQKRRRLALLENTRLGAAEKECQQARFDLRVARAELAAWEQRRPDGDRAAVSEQAVEAQLKDDAVSRKLLAELEMVEDQIRRVIRVSALRERDSSLPALYQRRDELNAKRMARRREVELVVEQDVRARAAAEHEARRTRLRDRVAFYEELVFALEQEVKKLGGAGGVEDLKALRDEIVTAIAAQRKLAAEIERAHRAAAAVPDMPETVEARPNEPARRVQLAGLGGAGSCALLVLGLSWRESRRRRITRGSDLVRGLGLPVVGSIPLEGKRRVVTVEDLDGGGSISEAVDALRTVLLHDKASGPRLLLVTSAVGGEGKTSLAVWLAASLARAWRRTLLIDADLRKPEVHALFETELEPGLSELLRGEAEPADVIQPVGLSRMWLVPAGHGDDHAIQALAQDGAGRVFDRLKEQFDFVVIDACSVLPVADVLLLGTRADAVLLTVRSGLSRLPLVQAAQQRLSTLDIPVRGAVLLGPDGDLAASSRYSSKAG